MKLPIESVPQILVVIDVAAETATIETPEGETTIAFAGRVGDRPVYLLTAPNGRTSHAESFRHAVESVVSKAIRSAQAIRKVRGAA